jgi:hypothetical protein
MLRGSMRFRGSMNLRVMVSARFNIYSCIIHVFFWSYSKFLCVVIHLSSFTFILIDLSNYSLHFIVLSSITKKGRLCASMPSRYVSVINDNHLVSLMNFNEAKVVNI